MNKWRDWGPDRGCQGPHASGGGRQPVEHRGWRLAPRDGPQARQLFVHGPLGSTSAGHPDRVLMGTSGIQPAVTRRRARRGKRALREGWRMAVGQAASAAAGITCWQMILGGGICATSVSLET